MEELAIKINELMGNKSKIKFLDLGEEGVRNSSIEIFRRIPSIEKAKLFLNYQPIISLDKGLEIIIGRNMETQYLYPKNPKKIKYPIYSSLWSLSDHVFFEKCI